MRFSIAQFAARALRDRATYRAFIARAGIWRNLLNPSLYYVLACSISSPSRYTASDIHRVPTLALRDARTGFGRNAVIVDGVPTPEG